ncbi:MAG: PLDc N-terminal domain-containing protein [Clostridiales bacterium]|nr:PLDc N-terminal domain-containing protein [Clostridiales bacterium]
MKPTPEMLKQIMPFLIPLIVVELLLLAYTIYHILTHEKYKRGNRILWIVIAVVGMQFWGPVLYFILGKEEE